MKTLLTTTLLTLATASVAAAQGATSAPAQPPPAAPCQPSPDCSIAAPGSEPQVAPAAPMVAYAEPMAPQGGQPTLSGTPVADPSIAVDGEGGWKRPVGRRFLHGFRLGYTYLAAMDQPRGENGERMSLKDEYGLKSPHMMLLGYEGFYRIVGHSWLNVLLVGNITVAGLEQSKFIPAASGLIGFEFQESFQVGVGVNLTPDPHAPSHMIAAAGWTPKVGSIHTPVHVFFVPDTDGNHRTGMTVGMSW